MTIDPSLKNRFEEYTNGLGNIWNDLEKAFAEQSSDISTKLNLVIAERDEFERLYKENKKKVDHIEKQLSDTV